MYLTAPLFKTSYYVYAVTKEQGAQVTQQQVRPLTDSSTIKLFYTASCKHQDSRFTLRRSM